MAKRANQINSEIKRINGEIRRVCYLQWQSGRFFENKEQIEVSEIYEKLPKPHALAVQEWLDGKIYHRDSNK
jgi:hypothetical protein